ncbi:ATP-binding protein [Streptomyces violaceusniger]|uniref:ATP-binding protein n=1 Tax=Streptomyces violaceusniger TaxID=68280 RepID=UPI00382B2FF4
MSGRGSAARAVEDALDQPQRVLVDTAELLVSELTTNAPRNTATDSYVNVDWQPKPPDFRVTVWDSGSALPQPVQAEADDEGGRGLAHG